ncbi:hypothetical protein [Chitinophaga sp. CF418]|uniref:hypothetical protein n=1 Tax=Chitinophaga sp. CF418 TaxID=1855287 RepID=UPI0009132B13|nr:hypothetical protein [Chitinophaga sp. CF418]SHN44018.1 hypothetical protein SAMN05216311_116173 [Chitinophaga sp. CF418]
MAFIKQNKMMEGTSGTIGNVTFSVRKDKTVSGPRRGPSTKPPTENQVAVQLKFERSLAYAQEAMSDPVKKLLYEKAATGGQTAYNAAFRDAARPPRILEIDTKKYQGLVGNVIRILVKDVVRVESVKVTILSAAGAELEQGDAVPGTGNFWNYTVTAANAALPGTRVVATAMDLPGNTTEKTSTIS